MAKKTKTKKNRQQPVSDPITDEKIRRLHLLIDGFRANCDAYERYLLATCEEENTKICRMYADKLAQIPKHVQEMTIGQIMAHKEQERRRNMECPTDEHSVRTMYERQKLTTEKKRTLKKERKRSVSSRASIRSQTINKSAANPFPRMSKALSESCLATPSGKFNRMSNLVVTPKFDPSLPPGRLARKPKPNEVVMSISGSPLQNYVDNNSTNSKLTLSLGNMKVLTYDEEAKIDKDFVDKLDEPMKQMLKDVKEKLDEILRS